MSTSILDLTWDAAEPTVTYLDDKLKSIDYVPRFRKQNVLYQHQTITVQAMIDMENALIRKGLKDATFELNSIVLAEPLGSGKTLEILAFIAAQGSRTVRAIPPHTDQGSYYVALKNRQVEVYKGVELQQSEIEHWEERVIRPTLIYCADTVYDHWVNTLKEFTTLAYLPVGNDAEMVNFIEHMKAREPRKINMYDVVLVRLCHYKNIVLKADGKHVPESYSLDLVNLYTRKDAWARVVYDDFDMISAKASQYIDYTNSLFNVFVSSTGERQERRAGDNTIQRVEAFARIGSEKPYKLSSCVNKPEFIKQSLVIPAAQFIKYTLCHAQEKIISNIALLELDENKLHHILEYIHADDLGNVINVLGHKVDSIAEIFQLIYKQKYEQYVKDKKVIDDAIEAGDAELLSVDPKVIDSANKFKYLIERLTSDVQYERCQICDLDFEKTIIIMKCCQKVLCSTCAYGANNLNLERDTYGKCNDCRAQITSDAFIIAEYDPSKYTGDINVKLNTKEVAKIETLPDDATAGPIEDPPKTKAEAVARIIKGRTTSMKPYQFTPSIAGFMYGSGYVPYEGAEENRKWLVFSISDQSCNNIADELDREGISHMILKGSGDEVGKIIEQFRNNTALVLIIPSYENCAGLNLQFATDMIVAEKIYNNAIYSQMFGRGQRIGRTVSCRIHCPLYTNEDVLA